MKKLVAIILLVLGVFTGMSSAVEVTLFGSHQYIRTSGAPDVFSDTFSAYPGSGTLIIKNGNQVGENRIIDAISSAEVFINGEQIFGPNDFNQNVYLLEAPINLVVNNSITVGLASKPGSYIMVEVIADIDPPTVTFSAEPATIFIGDSSTLSWQTNNVGFCVIEPGIGSVDFNGTTVVSPTQTTAYSITATGLGGTNSTGATVTILNRPPVADIQTITTEEDTPASITLSGSDPDGDSLAFNVISQPLHGNLAGTPPNISYSPNVDFNGTDAFSFVVNDGTVDSDPATVSITVTAVNDAPVAHSQTIGLNEDESKPVVLTALDVEGDTLAYEIVGQPPNGALSGIAPDLIYTPDENYHGDDSFSFRVNDGNLSGNAAIVSLTINPVNDAPIAAAGLDQTVFRAGTVTLDGSASSDVDGDTLSFQWSFSSIPTGSAAALSDASAANPFFVPDIAGAYELQLIVNDGTVASSPDTVLITANPRRVTVPDVVGQLQPDAEAALIGETLTVGVISTAYSDTIPVDRVISQVPAAGASIVEGSAVDLVVSVGQENQTPTATISASPLQMQQGESVVLSWSSVNAQSAHIDMGIGVVDPNGSVSLFPDHTTTYTLAVTGPNGSASARVTVMVTGNPEPQPEGSFGEQYEDLVPPDATVDEYDPKRFSLITGLVQDLAGAPIEDVSITIHDHMEYGTAATDAEGRYSIPMEGGSTTTVVLQKEGLITTHRKVYVPWNDIAIAETVQMITEDPVSTTLTFDGNSEAVVIHQSTPVADEFGSRSASMVFTGDNRAFLVDENGNDVQELTTITTRATEYTMPKSMPAKLPPNSGYTYCVELAVDGAQNVRFEKSVPIYVDNFLGFDVGMAVPVGYYDRNRGVWVPSDNGVVVKLLDTSGDGRVDALDATGDDQPDDLDNNGSFSNDVQGLEDSGQYAPGATYWRAAVTHFTPWDCNWPYGPPEDAISPNPEGEPEADDQCEDDCQGLFNSYIETRSRIFHEDIPIAGTDLTLHYASNRVEGYITGITVPVSGDTVPAALNRVIAKVEIAGRTLEQTLDPLPNQKVEFIWEGMDCSGRPVLSPIVAHVAVGFVYDAVYLAPGNFTQAFAQAGTEVTGIRARREVISWKRNKINIDPKVNGKSALADGWTISNNHYLVPSQPWVLFKGDGMINRNNLSHINTIAGTGTSGFGGDGGPAITARLDWPIGVTVDAAGNLYIPDRNNHRVRKVDTEGIITTIAGTGVGGYSGDGGPAADAQLYLPWGVAVNAAGIIYIADFSNHRVRKVDTEGIITTIVGTGVGGYSGDGGPATDAQIDGPFEVAMDAANNIYIADRHNHCIRKVDTSGVISTVAGNGVAGYSGDGGPAANAQLNGPFGLAMDAAGDIYIADYYNHRIRKVNTSGVISTVAGNGVGGYSGDGRSATDAQLHLPYRVAVDAVGNIYIADYNNRRIRKVDTSGVISTVAGNGVLGYSGDGGPSVDAQLSGPVGVAVDAAGNLYIADLWNDCIRKIAYPSAFIAQMTAGDISFVEDIGLGHIFSSSGIYKIAFNLDSGVILQSFSYDEDNNLHSIIDHFGNMISIERDITSKVPTAIISPDGLRTELIIDTNNHLKQVTYPDGSHYDFEYTQDGLMTAEIEPEGNRFDHSFSFVGQVNRCI